MWSELNPKKDHPASRHKPESSVSTFCPQLEVIVVCFIILPGARAAATVNRTLSGYMIIYNKSWFVNSNQTFELAYLLVAAIDMDNKLTTLGGTASDVTVGKIAVRLQFSLSSI